MRINLFILFPYICSLAEARGPHHPRGEVVKRHVHYRPSKDSPEKLTQDTQLLHDKEHIQEHLEDVISEADLSKMSDEELEFYYFQVHDSDKNNKLDGLEILQAILHTQHDHDDDDHGDDRGDVEEQNGERESSVISPGSDDFEYLVELIDRVLKEDDADEDGYISYPEYVAGRKNSKNFNGYTKLPSVKMIR